MTLTKRRMKTLLIFFFILSIVIICAYLIHLDSLKNRIIDVRIEVERSSYSPNDIVNFTLIIEDRSIPFRIDELAEGAGLCVCRVPDGVDPYQILDNRTYLYWLSVSNVESRIGLSDYSNDNTSLTLSWNCTRRDVNSLMGDGSSDFYFNSPSGYYLIYRPNLPTSSNDNQLRFRLTEDSVFHLDGLNHSFDWSYDADSESLDCQLSIGNTPSEDGTEIELKMGLYANDGSGEELILYDQRNLTLEGHMLLNYSKSIYLDPGTSIYVRILILTPDGYYSMTFMQEVSY
jgi:hypothetical protein